VASRSFILALGVELTLENFSMGQLMWVLHERIVPARSLLHSGCRVHQRLLFFLTRFLLPRGQLVTSLQVGYVTELLAHFTKLNTVSRFYRNSNVLL